MEKPPHSRLASAVLAFGGFALTWFAFALIVAGTNSLRYESAWHGYYESADGWLNSTAGVSLEDAASWAIAIQAITIAILFHRALRRSRKAVAFWGCVVGAVCLVASAIHAVWIWQQYDAVQQFFGFPINSRVMAGNLPDLLGVAIIFCDWSGRAAECASLSR